MGVRRLSRSPAVFWPAVGGLALFTAVTVARAVEGGQAAAARFGSLRTAVVATRPVEEGTVLGPADVAEREVPAAFLPEGWTPSAADVVGHTLVVPLARNQPVLRAHVAPEGLQGVAALLPPGTRAVAVPTGVASPPLHRGDHVDVLATFERAQAGEEAPTFPVARSAPVVDVGEESATVAVAPEEASRVAFALAHGVVNLAVTPGPSGPISAGDPPPVAYEPGAPRARASSTTTPTNTR